MQVLCIVLNWFHFAFVLELQKLRFSVLDLHQRNDLEMPSFIFYTFFLFLIVSLMHKVLSFGEV